MGQRGFNDKDPFRLLMLIAENTILELIEFPRNCWGNAATSAQSVFLHPSRPMTGAMTTLTFFVILLLLGIAVGGPYFQQ